MMKVLQRTSGLGTILNLIENKTGLTRLNLCIWYSRSYAHDDGIHLQIGSEKLLVVRMLTDKHIFMPTF